ncbi:fibronectin type III-like domain-contianing protein [Halopseudomonas bauzanensis]|uniref:fibronectin type III-like domain-contianing protein n=1 Tax=Halopseudomonas bauzanensis TaxID=653930 RepID=UPI0025542CA4|nr:fibronectin type III-like domain-contianing protein [Halopseudomonas bauzanensis]
MVQLTAGEEQMVRFTIDEDTLTFFNARLEQVAEAGDFKVQVGLDSQAVQELTFELL